MESPLQKLKKEKQTIHITAARWEQNQTLNAEETHQDKGKKNTSEDSFTYVAFILTKLLKKTQRKLEYDIYTEEKKKKKKGTTDTESWELGDEPEEECIQDLEA